MNFNQLFQYFGAVVAFLGTIQAGLAAIAAGSPFTAPPVNTYIEGKHVAIGVTFTPLA